MRTNSGKDEGRTNLSDPTVRDHERAGGKSGTAVTRERDEPSGPEPKQRSSEMGSHARKSGQSGHGAHR